MKNKNIPAFGLLLTLSFCITTLGRQQDQSSKPKVSEAEAKALTAIEAASDANAKLTAAEDFVTKYPKSEALTLLADQLAVEISKVGDATQKLAFADRFQKAFGNDRAFIVIESARLDAYAATSKYDEAFAVAEKILTKNPDEVHTLVQMTLTGTEEAKKGVGKHVPQTQQYGQKAIELIEANKKPATMDEGSWSTHKATLPLLYEQTGILAMLTKNPEDAKVRLTKSIALKPDDPSTHAMMAYLINNDYVQLAETYKTLPEGKAKEDMLKKLEGMIDSIIEAYAQTVALATGKPEYQPLLQQVLPDLTNYYKFRHNQSTQGLQELIDKYKSPATAKP